MDFRFRFSLGSRRAKFTFGGIAGVTVLVGIFAIPNLLSESLDPVRAEEWIRRYLKQQAMNGRMEELKMAGLSAPDEATAKQWQADLQHIDRMAFESIEIRPFLVAPPGTTTRIFTAKVVVDTPETGRQTRYFSLSARNRFFDFFWVNDKVAPDVDVFLLSRESCLAHLNEKVAVAEATGYRFARWPGIAGEWRWRRLRWWRTIRQDFVVIAGQTAIQ